MTIPQTSRNIARKVWIKERLYEGEYFREAPDLVIDQEKGVHISGSIGKKKVFEDPEKWIGENKKRGLFMAYGPDIKSNTKLSEVSILDLAPTVLHIYGLAIPKRMDGEVLKEIFKESSEIFRREPVYSNRGEQELVSEVDI